MSFKNCWTISSSYDFQARQQRSQKTMLSFPGCSTVIWSAPRDVFSAPRLVFGAPRLVIDAPRLVAGGSRCSHACCQCSQVLPGSPPVLLWPPRLVAGAPRCTWRPPHLCSTLWNLTTLGFWFDNFLTLPEAPRGSHIQKYILLMSKFAPWWPPSTQSSSSGAPWILPTHHVQPVQIYCV